MHALSTSKRRRLGFTLVELVMVIVLLGVLAVASTQFISLGVGIYKDTSRRDNLQQLGRFAVERVSRELRNALPGSVRLVGSGAEQCIEFVPVEAASTYTNSIDVESASLQAVDFSYGTAAVSDRRVAIFTLDQQDVYDYDHHAVVDLANIDAAASSLRQVNFNNTSGTSGHVFANESPARRFYIITKPVSFCVRGTQLFRHSGYDWSTAASSDSGDLGVSVLLAEHIQTEDDGSVTVFGFSAGTLLRAGIVQLDFRFSDSSADDEWLRFSQQVSLRNTP